MTDLLLNYALKFPVDAMPPCFCGSSGAVSSEAVNLLPPHLPPPDQPVSPAAASVASTQQPVYGTLRTSSGRRARTGLYPPSLYILSVWLLLLLSLLLFNFRPEELFLDRLFIQKLSPMVREYGVKLWFLSGKHRRAVSAAASGR